MNTAIEFCIIAYAGEGYEGLKATPGDFKQTATALFGSLNLSKSYCIDHVACAAVKSGRDFSVCLTLEALG